jgi:hypothetical protein
MNDAQLAAAETTNFSLRLRRRKDDEDKFKKRGETQAALHSNGGFGSPACRPAGRLWTGGYSRAANSHHRTPHPTGSGGTDCGSADGGAANSRTADSR